MINAFAVLCILNMRGLVSTLCCAGALLKGEFNGCAYHILQRPTEPEVSWLVWCASLRLCACRCHVFRCARVCGLTLSQTCWQLARLLGLFHTLAERTAELLLRHAPTSWQWWRRQPASLVLRAGPELGLHVAVH